MMLAAQSGGMEKEHVLEFRHELYAHAALLIIHLSKHNHAARSDSSKHESGR